MLKDEQKSAKTLLQRLAGLNKGRGAWGENLACGVARQSVLLGRSGAWQGVVNLATHNTAQRGEFDNETAQQSKIQHNEFIKANTANGTHNTTNSTKNSEFGNANSVKRYFASETMHDTASTANSVWRVFASKASKAKMGAVFGRGTSLSLSLSLVARTFWHTFGLNLKGFFTHFVVVLFRFIVDFAHFIAISSHLVVNFSYFIAVLSCIFVAFSHLFIIAFRFVIVLTHLFAYKRHFLGHYAFLKFLMLCFWVFYACHC
mgnify:CR=1 FL=1